MLARISHPMPTYLVWNENQSCRSSAHARQTRHTQTQANLEPERQSLDLHRLPNQTNTLRIRTANRWAYIHILTHKRVNKQTHTGTRMPLDGLTSASKHTTTKRVNRESETRAYNRQAHTQKEKKCPERPRTVSCLRTSSGTRIRAM